MKIKIGAILLIILATVGFSGTMAAQHVEEKHTCRQTHGPPITNTHTIYIRRRHKPRSHQFDCF
ncbi:hypothetical protein [Methanobacterium sp.]|uniref:hypothetical protein n=1 Tax=Methanobacterium sp. TaxID=2164 RepID=UPI003C776F26